jgi:hypothetical protein
MIELAHYLGKLKGVSEIDEGYTPITLRNIKCIDQESLDIESTVISLQKYIKN